MTSPAEQSPRAATVIGLIFILLGALPILGALDIVHLPLSGVPVWVGVAAGLTFVLGGAAVIVGYAIAGVEIDDPDAEVGPYEIHVPFAVRLTQYILVVAIYGLFAAIAGWFAFGARSLPWVTSHGGGSEWISRAAFGFVAIACAAAGIAAAVRNFKKLTSQ
ncbi:MAG TPA: hypothetical protein VGZ27_03130 [Vicinamibacterales bacterium]|jgi:hypothetical protein|nr:hypothetical protein [Vicinamibacterales bacterium]